MYLPRIGVWYQHSWARTVASTLDSVPVSWRTPPITHHAPLSQTTKVSRCNYITQSEEGEYQITAIKDPILTKVKGQRVQMKRLASQIRWINICQTVQREDEEMKSEKGQIESDSEQLVQNFSLNQLWTAVDCGRVNEIKTLLEIIKKDVGFPQNHCRPPVVSLPWCCSCSSHIGKVTISISYTWC